LLLLPLPYFVYSSFHNGTQIDQTSSICGVLGTAYEDCRFCVHVFYVCTYMLTGVHFPLPIWLKMAKLSLYLYTCTYILTLFPQPCLCGVTCATCAFLNLKCQPLHRAVYWWCSGPVVQGHKSVLIWVLWLRDTSLPYWACCLLVMFRLW